MPLSAGLVASLSHAHVASVGRGRGIVAPDPFWTWELGLPESKPGISCCREKERKAGGKDSAIRAKEPKDPSALPTFLVRTSNLSSVGVVRASRKTATRPRPSEPIGVAAGG